MFWKPLFPRNKRSHTPHPSRIIHILKGHFVGILGAVRACAMRPILNLRYIPYCYCFPEHFTSIPFYFVVYSIYTRACTVVTHPFVSVSHRDNRKSHPQSCPDHANSRSLLIRFQHISRGEEDVRNYAESLSPTRENAIVPPSIKK